MAPTTVIEDPGPASLIESSGLALNAIARKANLNFKTVQTARDLNQWPRQNRTRMALSRALGAALAPLFPITINSAEECRAVLASLEHCGDQPASHGDVCSPTATAKAQA